MRAKKYNGAVRIRANLVDMFIPCEDVSDMNFHAGMVINCP